MPLPELSQQFLTYDYAETKDLCKQFLTLVPGVLVFSIAFAEKIVDLRGSASKGRWALFMSWLFQIAAIVSCGGGLILEAMAAEKATYGQPPEVYQATAHAAYFWILSGCAAFGLGLASLITAGAASLFDKQKH